MAEQVELGCGVERAATPRHKPIVTKPSYAPAMLRLTAEIRPSDILGFLFSLALAAAGIALLIGLLRLLFEPLYALLTGSKLSEESATLWFWILVAGAIVGLCYWQFS